MAFDWYFHTISVETSIDLQPFSCQSFNEVHFPPDDWSLCRNFHACLKTMKGFFSFFFFLSGFFFVLCNNAIANRFSWKWEISKLKKHTEETAPVRANEIIFSCLLDLRSFSTFNSSLLEKDGPFFQYIVKSTFFARSFLEVLDYQRTCLQVMHQKNGPHFSWYTLLRVSSTEPEHHKSFDRECRALPPL